MRHDWTLLCADVTAPPSGSIDLLNVVTAIRVGDRYRQPRIDTMIPIHAPMWIVSQWTAEFDFDRRIHQSVQQLMAPGGENVLDQRGLDFDFRHTTVYRYIHRIHEMRFVGVGTYEFHILVADFAQRGEWGRASVRMI